MPVTVQLEETAGDVVFVQATPTSVAVEVTYQAGKTSTPDRAFENGQSLAARVNHQPLLLETYQQRLAQFEQAVQAQGDGISQTDMQRQVLDGLLDELIVTQYAVTLGITFTQQNLETSLATESQEQIEAWLITSNLTSQQFVNQLGQQWIANQVFEQVTHNAPQNPAQVQMGYLHLGKEDIARLTAELLNQDELFEALAQKSLVDQASPLAQGALLWLPRHSGLIPAEVEEVAFSMQPDQVSGPVRSPSGVYIVKVVARESARPLTDNMLQMVKKQMFFDWLKEQRVMAAIEVYVAQ